MKGIYSKMPSKSTHLVSSIRAVVIKREVAVDPNGACADGSRHSISYIQVLGNNTSCKAIFCVVCLLNCLVNCPAKKTREKIFQYDNVRVDKTDVKSMFLTILSKIAIAWKLMRNSFVNHTWSLVYI